MDVKEVSAKSVEIEVAHAEADMARTHTLKRSSTGISIGAMTAGSEPKTDLEKALVARLAQADTNNDGKLNRSEVIALVKDLVLEQRAKSAFKLVASVALIFLLASLCANFGLVYWGVQLSKDAYITPMATPMAASPADASAGAPASAMAAPDVPTRAVTMTASDGITIVATAPATTTMPIYVAPVMALPSLEQAAVEITYTLYDYEQLATAGGAARRRLKSADYDKEEWKKTETLKVENIEKLSDTHIKFHGKDGIVIEVKDGETYATTPDYKVGKLLGSPALGGSKMAPKDTEEEDAGFVIVDKDGVPTQKRYSKKDIAEETVMLKQPVCGHCTITVGAATADAEGELVKLEEKAVLKLDEKGVDVEDKKGDMRRRLSAEDAVTRALKAPMSFERACGSAIKTVLMPVIDALSVAEKKLNKEDDCEVEENPACYPCTDSTLGCEGIEIQHEGRLADHAEPEEFEEEEEVDAEGETNTDGDATDDNRRTRRALSENPETDPETIKTSKLFVSEKVGGDDGKIAEFYFSDEGICGVVTKGDSTKAIRAIKFKPCKEGPFRRRRLQDSLTMATGGGGGGSMNATWSKWYGVQGRAMEMKATATNPATASKLSFGTPPTSNFAMGARRLASADPDTAPKYDPDTDPDLVYTWTVDGKIPFDGFKATGGKVLGSLTFTTGNNYTTGKYAAKLPIAAVDPDELGVKMGEGGKKFPPLRKGEHPDERPTITRLPSGRRKLVEQDADTKKENTATLGTRLVGARIESDAAIKSITFVYKDDCSPKVKDLDEYVACKARVKNTFCPTNECHFASEETIKLAADA